MLANQDCQFNRWTKISGMSDQKKEEPAVVTTEPDLNLARKEIEALVDAASAVAFDSRRLDDSSVVVSADVIDSMVKRVLAVYVAMRVAKPSD